MACLQKINVGKTLGLFVWLLALLIGLGKPEAAHALETGVKPFDIVCDNWPIPTGFVIVSVQASQTCIGGATEYTVSPPSEGLTVCYKSPIPAPYVITSLAVSNKCGGLDQGTIRNIVDGMSVCKTSPIPDGYVVASAYNDNVTCRGAVMYRVAAAGNGVAMCNFSVRPTGYVVNRVSNSGQCLGTNAYVCNRWQKELSAVVSRGRRMAML
jgi:hypothetical protein